MKFSEIVCFWFFFFGFFKAIKKGINTVDKMTPVSRTELDNQLHCVPAHHVSSHPVRGRHSESPASCLQPTAVVSLTTKTQRLVHRVSI